MPEKIPCVIHNRVSTSRLLAEEEGNAVDEPAVEEKSSIEAADEEAEDETEEVKEAEKDKPLVLSDWPSGGKVTTVTVHLGMSGHTEPLVCQS